jgi:hypothetical protein
LLGLALLGLTPALAVAAQPRLSPRQLRQDLAALDTAIRTTHPDPSHSTDATELARAMRAVKQQLDHAMTRDEAWRAFATLNPVLADGHLFVGYADWRADSQAHLGAGGAFFPFEVQVTPAGEVFVQSLLGGGDTPLAGARIVSIDGVDAGSISAELLARMHGDTPTFRAQLLSRRWWFFFWKRYGARADFKLVVDQGTPSRIGLAGSTSQPTILADENRFDRLFRLELLPDRGALLTVGSFAWPDKPQLLAFTRDAFAKLREADVKTLIIDVRDNGGGNDDQWIEGILPYIATKPYRWASSYRKKILAAYRSEGETVGDVVTGTIDRWIPPEPDNPLRYSGKTYVLIGPSTYSSAIVFSNVVQDFGFATVAGTGGSARAEQSGGVQKIVLPNTGLAVWVPRFVLTRPSGAKEPVLVTPEVPLPERPLQPRAAVEALMRRGDRSE